MELIKTDEKKAYEYAKKLFDKKGFDIDKEIPNFDKLQTCKKLARMGFAQRKDMPVIDNRDIKLLQRRLNQVQLIFQDLTKNEVPDDPFPQGLDKETGKKMGKWWSCKK